jgi:hypothetical protein
MAACPAASKKGKTSVGTVNKPLTCRPMDNSGELIMRVSYVR